MPSTHEATVSREVYEEGLADRVKLQDQLAAVRAIVNDSEPHYLADIYAASRRLYALLAIPDQRPAAWEAAHVSALAEPLCEILDALRCERPDEYERAGA